MRRSHSKLKAYGIIAAVSYLVAVIIFQDFLFTPGVVNTGDLGWPYFRSQAYQYTTTLHQLPNHIPYFELLWSLPVSTGALERLLYLSVYTLIGTVGGSVVYEFVVENVDIDETTAIKVGVLGGVLYQLNPLNVFYASQIFLPLGYALYPIVIYLVYSVASSPPGRSLRYGVLLGIVVAATSGDPRWPVWSFVAIGVLLVTHSRLEEHSMERLVQSLRVVGVAGVCFLALAAFWVVPLLHPEAGAASPLAEQSPLTEQNIDMLNRDSTWVNALRFHADWWPPLQRAFVPEGTAWRGAWYVSGMVLPVVAFASLIVRRKRTVPLAVLFAMFLFLTTAPTSASELISGLYDEFVFILPFGATFRTAFKWLLPASFPVVLMASMAVGTLLSSKKGHMKILGMALVAVLILSAGINSWLLFVGDMGGQRKGFVPRQLPEHEQETYQDIYENGGEHAVLALPEVPRQGLPARTIGKNSFSERLPRLTAIHGRNATNSILRQVSVKYLINYTGQMKVSRIRGAEQAVHVPNTVISGELPDSYPIQEVVGLNDTSIVTSRSNTNSALQVIRSSGTPIFYNGTIVRPYEYTHNWNPNSGWARTEKSFTPTRRMKNALGKETATRLFAGRQMVVTSTNQALQRPASKIELQKKDRVAHWDFERKHQNRTEFTTEHDIDVAIENGHLTTTLDESSSGWKVVSSPKMEVVSGTQYRFAMSMRAVAAHQVHLRVSAFDAHGNRLGSERIFEGGDGTFQERVRFGYEPQDRNISYVRLEIWQGHETPKPLPNRLWIDDVSVYNVSRYVGPVSMDVPFSVGENGSYKLFARYVESRSGGAVRVLVDGEPVTLRTKGRPDELVENEIGTFELEEGRHTLTLINENGVNAITAFSLMKEQTYKRQYRSWRQSLANRTLIHLLEAETELYVHSSHARNSENSSIGTDDDLVELQDGSRASKIVQVRTNGSYRPAVRGIGNFTLHIDGRAYQVEADELQLHHLEAIDLSAGQHNISITSDGRGYLDTVWLYTTAKNRTLAEALSKTETNARVESFERVDATKYRVHVDASEAYTLSFAEDYSPLWVAEVRTSDGTEQYDPVPLYSVINGFQIDKTGEQTVILRYRPQQWYYSGIVVSSTAFALCIGYLAYDWRQRRDGTRSRSIRQTPKTDGSFPIGGWSPNEWPLSNYVISFGILLLATSGLALAVPAEVFADHARLAYYALAFFTEANTFARFGYFSVALGIVLRFGEIAFGKRI